jgi:hypothetical protein
MEGRNVGILVPIKMTPKRIEAACSECVVTKDEQGLLINGKPFGHLSWIGLAAAMEKEIDKAFNK